MLTIKCNASMWLAHFVLLKKKKFYLCLRRQICKRISAIKRTKKKSCKSGAILSILYFQFSFQYGTFSKRLNPFSTMDRVFRELFFLFSLFGCGSKSRCEIAPDSAFNREMCRIKTIEQKESVDGLKQVCRTIFLCITALE